MDGWWVSELEGWRRDGWGGWMHGWMDGELVVRGMDSGWMDNGGWMSGWTDGWVLSMWPMHAVVCDSEKE